MKKSKKTIKKSKKAKKKIKKLLIITGEKSGELLAVDVVRELKKLDSYEFIGTGGELLEKEGMRIIEHIQNMEVIGIIEALKAYSFLKKLLKKILSIIKEENIQYVLLVDYPGFNLRLAKELKKINSQIKIFYFVSPQIWAWNYKRIKLIKKVVDKMYVLFEFEKEIYEKENVPVKWVGHPIKFRIPKELRKQPILQLKHKPVIGILPGSRYSEVSQLLIPMLEAAKKIQSQYPDAIFLIPSPSDSGKVFDYINQTISLYKDLNLKVLPAMSLRVMQSSDLLIIASGTATLEAAFFKKPMIICYKVGWLNYFIISLLIKTRYIGLPNLLAKEQVAIELLQNEVHPDNIYNEAIKILQDSTYRNKIVKLLKEIPLVPENKNPAKIVADDLYKLIK
ncbi:MAG: lipid-A-disaccharide synthase [Leptospiraceae bacterium]|nr:MAG: lipid-A-disaccharide synthase [Leptospiraceae bacterium]